MRTLNAAGQALQARQDAGEQIPVVLLIELQLTVPQYLTTAGIPLPWNGRTWEPRGVRIDAVEEDAQEFSVISFALPALTEAQLALALVEDISEATVRVYSAWVDPDTGVVADASLEWSGALNVPAIEDGMQQAELVVTAEHRGSLALRVKPSRYTNDEQRRIDPTDSCLDIDPAIDAAPLPWPNASYFYQ